MGCGTMTLLKSHQVFAFGAARQRSKLRWDWVKLPECPETVWSILAALLRQIKGWSFFLTELCRCALWLGGILHLHLHLLRLQQLSGYLALPLIDGWGVGVNENISRIIASDWWAIWHINYKHWLTYNKFWNIAQIRHRFHCHSERVESKSCHLIQARKAHQCLLDFISFHLVSHTHNSSCNTAL